MENNFKRSKPKYSVKNGVLGLLALALFLGTTPALAQEVIIGAVPDSNANYLFGVTYRSFATSNPEAILGLTPLSTSNPVTGDVTWNPTLKNYFKFTYDLNNKVLTTVIFQIDPVSKIQRFLVLSSTRFPQARYPLIFLP